MLLSFVNLIVETAAVRLSLRSPVVSEHARVQSGTHSSDLVLMWWSYSTTGEWDGSSRPSLLFGIEVSGMGVRGSLMLGGRWRRLLRSRACVSAVRGCCMQVTVGGNSNAQVALDSDLAVEVGLKLRWAFREE